MPEGLDIYIALDGSAGQQPANGNAQDVEIEASWAFAVYAYDNLSNLYFLGFLSNTLRQSQANLPIFQFDSFDAETVAFFWALMWTISHSDILDAATSITYVFDSMSAIYASTALWAAKSPRSISRISQAMWETWHHNLKVQTHHIKSHTGNPLNGMVDSICTAVSKHTSIHPLLDCDIKFEKFAPALKWLF